MKVIHVTWQAWQYGIETFLLGLLPSLNRDFSDLKADIVFHKTNELSEKKYKDNMIKFYTLGASNAWHPKLFTKFKQIFKKYDIVNLHTYSPWAFLAAKQAGKKVVFTFHGALGLKNNWRDPIVKAFHCFIMTKYCNIITFASKSSLWRYQQGFNGMFLDKHRIKIFPYGMELDRVKPSRSRDKIRVAFGWQSRFVIGTAARLEKKKRLEYLIEGFRHFRGNKDSMLILMGSGSKSYREFLINLVRKYHIEDHVKFLGYREDVYDIMNALDLFVLPSREEPFGLALLEAMKLGVPSIVFKDGGGAVDIIGDSGYVVDSPKDLGEVMDSMKQDSTLRYKLGEKGKQRAELFNICNTAQYFHRLYKQLVSR